MDMLGVDKYLEVAEIYVLTLLGKVLNDMDRAISWVENASLPDDRRQVFRIHIKVSSYSSACSFI